VFICSAPDFAEEAREHAREASLVAAVAHDWVRQGIVGD
jgi:hypothetical protein